jgi:phosphocarrier protein
MVIMGMGIKQGDRVTVFAEGPDEDAAIAAMENFFRENL